MGMRYHLGDGETLIPGRDLWPSRQCGSAAGRRAAARVCGRDDQRRAALRTLSHSGIKACRAPQRSRFAVSSTDRPAALNRAMTMPGPYGSRLHCPTHRQMAALQCEPDQAFVDALDSPQTDPSGEAVGQPRQPILRRRDPRRKKSRAQDRRPGRRLCQRRLNPGFVSQVSRRNSLTLRGSSREPIPICPDSIALPRHPAPSPACRTSTRRCGTSHSSSPATTSTCRSSVASNTSASSPGRTRPTSPVPMPSFAVSERPGPATPPPSLG